MYVICIINEIQTVLASHTPHCSKKSLKFVNNFLSFPANLQRDKHRVKHTLLGGAHPDPLAGGEGLAATPQKLHPRS